MRPHANQQSLFSAQEAPLSRGRRYAVGEFTPSGKVYPVYFIYELANGRRVTNANGRRRTFKTRVAATKAMQQLERTPARGR